MRVGIITAVCFLIGTAPALAQSQKTPPVVVQPGDASKVFAPFPTMGEGRSRRILIGLIMHGDLNLITAMKDKISTESWESEFLTDRDGTKVLSVGTEYKSLEQAATLRKRVQDKEFGAVTVELLAIPDPRTAN